MSSERKNELFDAVCFSPLAVEVQIARCVKATENFHDGTRQSEAGWTNVWVYMLRNTEILDLSPLAANFMQPHRMPESRNNVGVLVLRCDTIVPRDATSHVG